MRIDWPYFYELKQKHFLIKSADLEFAGQTVLVCLFIMLITLHFRRSAYSSNMRVGGSRINDLGVFVFRMRGQILEVCRDHVQ